MVSYRVTVRGSGYHEVWLNSQAFSFRTGKSDISEGLAELMLGALSGALLGSYARV